MLVYHLGYLALATTLKTVTAQNLTPKYFEQDEKLKIQITKELPLVTPNGLTKHEKLDLLNEKWKEKVSILPNKDTNKGTHTENALHKHYGDEPKKGLNQKQETNDNLSFFRDPNFNLSTNEPKTDFREANTYLRAGTMNLIQKDIVIIDFVPRS